MNKESVSIGILARRAKYARSFVGMRVNIPDRVAHGSAWANKVGDGIL